MAEPPAEKNVLTASEVASWLRIPKSTLYKLAQERRIPATKIGRHWRFDRAIIEDWLKSQMNEGAALRPDDQP